MTTALAEKTEPGVGRDKVRKIFLEERTRSTGFYIWVDTRDTPLLLQGKTLKDVTIGSAWVSFSLDGKLIRTKTIGDRNNFLEWVDRGEETPISPHKEHREKFGPSNVTFLTLCALKTL